MRKGGIAGAHEGGVDVDFTHVIDDDSNLLALAISKNVIQQGRLSCAKEAGKYGDGEVTRQCRSEGGHLL